MFRNNGDQNNPNDFVKYDLYKGQDGNISPWAADVSSPNVLIGNSRGPGDNINTHTVTARIPNQSNANPGGYKDTVIVTLYPNAG